MARTKTYMYSIPLNEPAYEGASVTVLAVQITDDNPVRRGAKLKSILRQNYGITRQEAKDVIRAMGFDTVVV